MTAEQPSSNLPASKNAPCWQQHTAAITALVALSTCAYWGVWRYSFVNFDDGLYVTDNPHVTGGLTAANFHWAWSSLHAVNWHPLTWLSLQADASLFGPTATGFHVTNLLLHVANSVLLLLLCRRFFSSVWPGVVVAGLFAVHPQHVESVVWISERKDVLSVLFGLLALIGYCRYAERPSAGRYLAVTVAYLASLSAKPTLVTMPFLMLVFDWWPLRRLAPPAGGKVEGDEPSESYRSSTDRWDSLRSSHPTTITQRSSLGWLIAEKIPWCVVTIGSCMVTVMAQRAGAIRDTGDFDLAYRLSNAVAGYAFYVVKAIWPADLIVFYPGPDSYPINETLLRSAALLGITALARALRRSRPYVLFGWLWFVGTLVPVIGLVQVGYQAYADRYSYFPLVGLLVIFAGAIDELARARPAGRAAAAVIAGGAIAACLALTCQQREYWRDSRSLWQHALAVTPDNFCAHRFMADLLSAEGRPSEAIEHSQAAAAAKPIRNLYVHLGQLLLEAKRYDEAIEAFQDAVRNQPNDAESHFVLGDLLLKRQRPQEAARHFEDALAWQPGWGDAYNGLATAQSLLGEHKLAQESFAAAVAAEPSNALFRNNLAGEMARTGQAARSPD
jgi:tetratricopeptide (TPR) repeat protein